MIIVDYGVEKKKKQEYIIGIDVGTTETKATIFNSNGQIKGEISKELTPIVDKVIACQNS